MKRRSILCCIIGLGSLLGCGESAQSNETIYETTHLRIAHTSELPLCAGTVTTLEAETQRILDVQGLELPGKLRIDYGPEAPAQGCVDLATPPNEHPPSCAIVSNGEVRIWTDADSATHELVHGVRLMNYISGPIIFEEGLAEVLSGGSMPYEVSTDIRPTEPGPVELLDASSRDFPLRGYLIGAHFVSWLRIRQGDTQTMSYLTAPEFNRDQALEYFEQHFGISLDQAEQMWRADPLEDTSWGEYCTPVPWEGELLEFTGAVDCGDTRTQGPFFSVGDDISQYSVRSERFCFDVEQSTHVQVELQAASGMLRLREIGCWESGSPQSFQDKRIDAGTVQEYPFAGCTWMGYISHYGEDALEPMDYVVRLARSAE